MLRWIGISVCFIIFFDPSYQNSIYVSTYHRNVLSVGPFPTTQSKDADYRMYLKCWIWVELTVSLNIFCNQLSCFCWFWPLPSLSKQLFVVLCLSQYCDSNLEKSGRMIFWDSVAQPFWTRGTLIGKKKVWRHTLVLKRQKLYCFIGTFMDILRFGDTPIKRFHGTLMCRVTPVEKHCSEKSLFYWCSFSLVSCLL